MQFWQKWKSKTLWLQIVLILLGVVFIAIGTARGEVKTVLMKAIYICLECIGIG